jgi:hypothetical protein
MRDFSALAGDLSGGQLPSVVFIKGLGYHSEHPGVGISISAGVRFVDGVVSAVQNSSYAESTLLLLVWGSSTPRS